MYKCSNCNSVQSKWSGKCVNCGEWNTLVEQQQSLQNLKNKKKKSTQVNSGAFGVRLLSREEGSNKRFSSGFSEFDRVLGGGFVSGEVILLTGNPGIGKSTLLLQVVGNLIENGSRCLYISSEESFEQINSRGLRVIDVERNKDFNIYTGRIIEEAIDVALQSEKYDFVVIDSISTFVSNDYDGVFGGIGNIKTVILKILDYAKTTNTTVLVVGHVNKEGAIAGPKLLEHMVDALIFLEGDSHHDYRMLRSEKNRFGSSGEIGFFEMEEKGFKEIKNPSELFVSKLTQGKPGVVVGSAIEGNRCLFFEVQTLLAPSFPQQVRRIPQGISHNRLVILSAVASKYLKLKLENFDIYLSIAGGLKVDDPAIDLSVIMSIYSAKKGVPIAHETLWIGEVGLSGEVRRIRNIEKRIEEARGLGVTKVYTSILYEKEHKGVEITGLKNITDILSTK